MQSACIVYTFASSIARDRTSSTDSHPTDEDTQRLARTKNPACAAFSCEAMVGQWQAADGNASQDRIAHRVLLIAHGRRNYDMQKNEEKENTNVNMAPSQKVQYNNKPQAGRIIFRFLFVCWKTVGAPDMIDQSRPNSTPPCGGAVVAIPPRASSAGGTSYEYIYVFPYFFLFFHPIYSFSSTSSPPPPPP